MKRSAFKALIEVPSLCDSRFEIGRSVLDLFSSTFKFVITLS